MNHQEPVEKVEGDAFLELERLFSIISPNN
jgi:hypothetical protein